MIRLVVWVTLGLILCSQLGCAFGTIRSYHVSAPHLEGEKPPKKHVLQFPELYVSVKPYNWIHYRSIYIFFNVPVYISSKDSAPNPIKSFYVECCFYPTDLEDSGDWVSYNPNNVISKHDQPNAGLPGGFQLNKRSVELVPRFGFDPFYVELRLDNATHTPFGFYGQDLVTNFKIWEGGKPYDLYFSIEFWNNLRKKSKYFNSLVLRISGDTVIEDIPFDESNKFLSERLSVVDTSKNPIRLAPKALNCFLLAFDVESPSPKETFTLVLNGLRKEEQSLELPAIHMTKSTIRIDDIEVAVPRTPAMIP